MRISDWSSDVCSSISRHSRRGDQAAHPWRAAGRMVQPEPQIPAPAAAGALQEARSEERRVGKEGVSTGRSRWVAVHSKKKKRELHLTLTHTRHRELVQSKITLTSTTK